jgi:hypothetical protein
VIKDIYVNLKKIVKTVWKISLVQPAENVKTANLGIVASNNIYLTWLLLSPLVISVKMMTHTASPVEYSVPLMMRKKTVLIASREKLFSLDLIL